MVRSSNGQPAAASANATDPLLEIMMERLSIKGPDIPGLEEDALTNHVQEISLNICNASGKFSYGGSKSTRELTQYQQLEHIFAESSSARIEDAVPEAQRDRLRQLREGWKADRDGASNSCTPRKKTRSSAAATLVTAEVEEKRTAAYYAAASHFFSDNYSFLDPSDDKIPLFMAEICSYMLDNLLSSRWMWRPGTVFSGRSILRVAVLALSAKALISL